MTLNYNREVFTSKSVTFLKLLLNWKASIWKAVYIELIIWLLFYAVITLIYRFALTEDQKSSFESVVAHFARRLRYIPLDLVLGFYATQNFTRWDYRYRRIGFIDNVGLMVAEYVRGHCENGRRYRRGILRYCALGQILSFRDISLRVRRRFPTLDTVVAAGFMLPREKEELEELSSAGDAGVHQVPFQWALSLAYRARKEGHIEGDRFQQVISDQIKDWRSDIQECVNYDWTPLPLLYSNVVCLAVHSYFMAAILGRQFVTTEDAAVKTETDIYFPVMTILQYIFYLGWLKVGSSLINPFGVDDDHWESNALIDRNISMGMMMVDRGYNRPPEQRRDPFWEEDTAEPLYSEASLKDRREHALQGSVSNVRAAHSAVVRMVNGKGGHVDIPIDKAEVIIPMSASFADIRAAIERKFHHHRTTPKQTTTPLRSSASILLADLLRRSAENASDKDRIITDGSSKSGESAEGHREIIVRRRSSSSMKDEITAKDAAEQVGFVNASFHLGESTDSLGFVSVPLQAVSIPIEVAPPGGQDDVIGKDVKCHRD